MKPGDRPDHEFYPGAEPLVDRPVTSGPAALEFRHRMKRPGRGKAGGRREPLDTRPGQEQAGQAGYPRVAPPAGEPRGQEPTGVYQAPPPPGEPMYAHVAHPPGAGPPPPYQQVNVAQPAQAPYPAGYVAYPGGWRRRIPNLAAPIASILIISSGALVLLGTFLDWIFGLSGWDLMFGGGFASGRNFLFSWGRGIFFSGFWSLLFGVLIILGGVILLTDRVYGSDLTLVSGVVVLAISVVNIVMAYINTTAAVGPGAGLWLVAVFAFLAVIFGAVGIPRESYYLE